MDTDELIEFLKGCSVEARLLIKEMSISASAPLWSADKSLKRMTVLYYSADESVRSRKARAEVFIDLSILQPAESRVFRLQTG